jgi:hypothetical protein
MWSRIASIAVSAVYHRDVRSAPPGHSSNLSPGRARITPVRFRRGAIALASFVLLCVTASVCQAQTHEVVCSAGSGTFESQFHTGVKVSVAAARNDGLATRACAAELSWDKQKLVIAASAPRVDVDAFGADLGMGVPVAAIQVKKSGIGCCMSFQIYSLQKPPRLLRTITGADSFGAADTDLDGRVEIWADDSAAVDGFEHLDVRQLDFPPSIVLRFTNGQLLDVSAEFQSYFDQEIAKVRAALDAQQISDFKTSDGRLEPDGFSSLEDLRQNDYLQAVKLKVLEIVWSYVYSGREDEAWHALADMWPPDDVDRIRNAILQARAHGIRAQVDGVSTAVPTGRKEHVEIFDGIRPPPSNVPVVTSGRRGFATIFDGMGNTNKSDLVLPQPIQLWSPLKMDASDEVVMDLVIDSAGKVRSAEPVDHTKRIGEDLIAATAEWKFIPAFKDGRPVASRVRISVSPKM